MNTHYKVCFKKPTVWWFKDASYQHGSQNNLTAHTFITPSEKKPHAL